VKANVDPLAMMQAEARPGRTLIVGSHVYATRDDRRKAFPNCIGVDMIPGPGVDRVLDLEEPLPMDLHLGSFMHIECISVLEHSHRPWLLAANLERLLQPGGTLMLSVPFVWRLHNYPGDLFRYSCEGVRALFPQIEWSRLHYVVHTTLGRSIEKKIPVVEMRFKEGGLTYFGRTEVMGIGVRV